MLLMLSTCGHHGMCALEGTTRARGGLFHLSDSGPQRALAIAKRHPPRLHAPPHFLPWMWEHCWVHGIRHLFTRCFGLAWGPSRGWTCGRGMQLGPSSPARRTRPEPRPLLLLLDILVLHHPYLRTAGAGDHGARCGLLPGGAAGGVQLALALHQQSVALEEAKGGEDMDTHVSMPVPGVPQAECLLMCKSM